MIMKFDLYDFLKLKDKSQQLFIKNRPYIYIYHDLIVNTQLEQVIKLVNPEQIPFYKQLGCDNYQEFIMVDSAGNRIYYETLLRFDQNIDYDYEYTILEYDDNDWLIKTHRRHTYVDFVYNTEKRLIVANTYNNDGSFKDSLTHRLDDVSHIMRKKKLADNN